MLDEHRENGHGEHGAAGLCHEAEHQHSTSQACNSAGPCRDACLHTAAVMDLLASLPASLPDPSIDTLTYSSAGSARLPEAVAAIQLSDSAACATTFQHCHGEGCIAVPCTSIQYIPVFVLLPLSISS